MPSHITVGTRLAAFGSLLAMVAGCHHGEEPPVEKGSARAQPAVRVVVRYPERKTLVRKIVLPAQVEAFVEAPLLAKVTGYVRHVHVDIGDPVRGPRRGQQGQAVSGDLLVEIDVPELVNERAQRNAPSRLRLRPAS